MAEARRRPRARARARRSRRGRRRTRRTARGPPRSQRSSSARRRPGRPERRSARARRRPVRARRAGWHPRRRPGRPRRSRRAPPGPRRAIRCGGRGGAPGPRPLAGKAVVRARPTRARSSRPHQSASACSAGVPQLVVPLLARLQRVEVAQDDARLDRAVEAVDLEAHRGIHGVFLGRTEARAAEGDGLGPVRARVQAEARVPPLPHRPHVTNAGRGDEEVDAGVAGAERAQLLELLGEAEPEPGAADHHVHPLGALGRVAGEDLRGVIRRTPGGTRRARPASARGRPPRGGRRSATGAPRRHAAPRAGRSRGCCAPSRGPTRPR